MYAVIGRVMIKPDRADEAGSMIGERGVAMLQGMTGSAGGYWARSFDEGDIIQHSFWLFDTVKRPSSGGDFHTASRAARRAGDVPQRGCLSGDRAGSKTRSAQVLSSR